MIKQTVKAVIKDRDKIEAVNTLLHTASTLKVSAVPQYTPKTIFLGLLDFEVTGEKCQIDTFRELVIASPLTYTP